MRRPCWTIHKNGMFYTFSLLSIRAGMQEVDKKSLKYVSGKCEKTALC